MSLEIIQYKPEHALEIIASQAMQPCLEVTEQTTEWARLKKEHGPAVSGLWHGKLIGCGGLEIPWSGMAEAWLLFAKDVSSYPVEVRLRFIGAIRDAIDLWIKEYGLVRIQAPLRADFPLGLRFAKAIGFQEEGRLRKYHPDGVDALMHSIIVEK